MHALVLTVVLSFSVPAAPVTKRPQPSNTILKVELQKLPQSSDRTRRLRDSNAPRCDSKPVVCPRQPGGRRGERDKPLAVAAKAPRSLSVAPASTASTADASAKESAKKSAKRPAARQPRGKNEAPRWVPEPVRVNRTLGGYGRY